MIEGLRRPRRWRDCACVLTAALAAAVFFAHPSDAQVRARQIAQTSKSESARAAPPERVVRRAPSAASIGESTNANTVAVISGNLNATYLTIAYDMSAVLDDGDKFRILPIVGKGGGQNIRDVRFLKGVDLGITQSNLLGYYRRSNEIGPIDDKIVYVAKLFNEEMHLVVRADSGIGAIAQLDGQKVNFSDIGSGTQLSTRDIFERLGIKPVEVNMGQADAFEKLKSGEIAATVLIAGKPAASMAKLKAAEGFRLLPVPFARSLQNDYLPATLANADYPGMIAPGGSVDTVAVGAVLIAYNWPRDSDRYRRIEKFVEHFFPRLAEFQKAPRHPKWMETNLATVVPGWTRFPAAEEWLQRHGAPAQMSRAQFEQFLAAREPGESTENREKLFQEFLKWNQTRERR